MGTINIQVVARIATNLTPAEVIVCDNSGYTLAFTFDEEWAAAPERVARFVYKKGYQTLYQEQPFEGNTVDVPELHDVDMVHVGVYAGDLQTTTPAMIVCRRSILGGDPIEDLPAPVRASLQRQIGDLDDLATEEKANLVAAINEVMAKAGGEISDEQVAQAVTAYLTEHPVQAGATAEQAAQIQANKQAIEQLQQNGTGTPGADGVDGKDGEDGEDGGYYTPAVTQPAANTLEFNFTPSKADMPAVDPVQVALPAAPDSGGNVDLTGYATEEWVQEGYQPKGDYLTDTQLDPVRETAADALALATRAVNFHPIVETASGEMISVSDASDANLEELRIFGKTTQNGTPTPDAPVPLESVGDGGSVGVTVRSKNLFGGDAFADKLVSVSSATKNEENKTVYTSGSKISGDLIFESAFKENTPYTIIFKCHSETAGNINLRVRYTDGTTSAIGKLNENEVQTLCYVTDKSKTVKSIYGANTINVTYYYDECGIFEGVLTADDFEPYKDGGSLSISTPNGLPGIPVTSGGNYTDENGQQWVCDEVDFARAVYAQRIGKIDSYTSEEIPGAYISTTGGLSAGATVLYALPEPIEHDLTAEELAQYATLHTKYPNTTIYNDGGAGMAVKYVADTKMYIDKKFAELSTALLNQ